MLETPRVQVAYANHPGRRPTNGDALFAGGHVVQQRRLGVTAAVLNAPAILAVSDGLSRAPHGATASRAVLTDLADDVARTGAGEVLSPSLVRTLQHRLVARFADTPGHRGCGATLALVQIHAGVLHVLNVGDCRVYRVSTTNIERLSREPNDVRFLSDAGQFTVDAALRTPSISRPRGRALVADTDAGDIAPHVSHHALVADDWVLLCTDGLTDALSDTDIFDLRRLSPTVQDWIRLLVRCTQDGATRDNVTVVAASF